MSASGNVSVNYSEWLYPRISSFLPLVMLIPAVWIVGAPLGTDLGLLIGLMLALIAAAIKLKSAPRIQVTTNELILGNAKIPLAALGQVSLIAKEEQFFERGAKLDARAFVFFKYGLPELLKIENRDKNDPTPYLLVSTRRAAELIKALS